MPSYGISAPLFRDTVELVLARECFTYTVSEVANRSLGVCNDGTGITLEMGPIQGELEPIEITATPTDATLPKAWLAPGGDELVVHQYHGQPAIHRLNLYRRAGVTWTFATTISESAMFITAGVPSAGPERRLIESSLQGYRELAERGGVWVEVHRGPWAELLSTGNVGDHLNLSADGLRMTFTENNNVQYTDRPSLEVPFRVSVRLASVGHAYSAHMVDNCGKIYFTGLGSVFYRYQR